MPLISIVTDNRQGAISERFQLNLNGDYIVLTGENNTGKSSLLQFLFKRCADHSIPAPLDQACLILPDRMYVDVNTNTVRRLADYNRELASSICGNNRSYQAPNISPSSSELPKLLLHHTSFLQHAGNSRSSRKGTYHFTSTTAYNRTVVRLNAFSVSLRNRY